MSRVPYIPPRRLPSVESIAIAGKRGSGKTDTSIEELFLCGEKVLIIDMMNEFGDCEAITLEEVPSFDKQEDIEIKRIVLDNMTQCNLIDKIVQIMKAYKGGYIYITGHIYPDPRESALDLFLAYVGLGRSLNSGTILENQTVMNLFHPKYISSISKIRLHHTYDNLLYRNNPQMLGERLEIMYIAQRLVEIAGADNPYYHVYIDLDNMYIKGEFTVAQACEAIKAWMEIGYKRIKTEIRRKTVRNILFTNYFLEAI